jgi:pimeloyl-ACP methyl ester carboxylesterase
MPATVPRSDAIKQCRCAAKSALLVGHDWGGSVAWATAMNHPEVVDRLAILNAAHPRKLSEGLHHPGQLRRSWYFFFFDLRGQCSLAALWLWHHPDSRTRG